MNTTLAAVGQSKSWSLIHKLGEGDAGEVYLVESPLDHKQAILKRPRKSAFSSDVIRQASQIEIEGHVLRDLHGLRILPARNSGLPKVNLRIPTLLDQSQAGTEYSERFFIVMDKATGFDLNLLARTSRKDNPVMEGLGTEEAAFLTSVAETGVVPDLVLLRVLTGVLQMLEAIHGHSRLSVENSKAGIAWNDVKPEHIFWDPQTLSITVIDWGNAQFLEADGYNKERRISKNDDYAQFLQAFGSYLETFAPQLLDALKWPRVSMPTQPYTEILRPLKNRIGEEYKQREQELHSARKREMTLTRSEQPTPDELQELFEAQHVILALGEIPDFAGGERYCTRLANRLTSEGRLDEFANLSATTCPAYANDTEKWQALSGMAQAATQENPALQPMFLRAIRAGLIDDWASALWELLAATADEPEPGWWDGIGSVIRLKGLGIGVDNLPPLVALRRNVLLLLSALQKMRDEPGRSDNDPQILAFENLIKILREDVIVKWEEIEPDPPDCGLAYNDLDRLLEVIGAYVPEAQQAVSGSLAQSKAQVRIILEAWEGQEFDSARRGLRRLLLWDPDRRRVLLADRAIAGVQKWLAIISQGPQNEQPMLEFAANNELTGRELRSRIGPASWLDTILEVFSQLRKNRKPGELLVERPEISKTMPWLEALEPRRYIPAQPARPIQLEREEGGQIPEATVRGIQECLLGAGQEMLLAEPLDTWAPEARGSSARTFVGFLRTPNNQLKQAAIKIMRSDRVEYSLPLYREEVQILNIMHDTPGVTPMLECGFIRLSDGDRLPPDNRPLNGRALTGAVQRFAPDQVPNFLSALDAKAHQGWLPYLVMPKLDNQENLMWVCDSGYTRGRFLPVEESLRLALHICDILQTAHERNIVYRDHKLLHYYWLDIYNGVFMIDWNVARYHPEGLTQAEIHFDLVQLGARALHHIFTGRVAPGALADGPNKVEEIEAAAQSYRAQWTYDDQRLPPSLKEVLEQILSGSYSRISRLREDLQAVYHELIEKTE